MHIDSGIFEERNFHGVKGLVFIGDKMLVYRRDANTTSFPLHIDLPGGGKEGHESPFACFRRETMEEFGVGMDRADIVYAKMYTSAMDPTKESYFLVTRSLDVKESDIVFGDEGLEFMLLAPAEYLKLDDAIQRHKDKVVEYLDTLR